MDRVLIAGFVALATAACTSTAVVSDPLALAERAEARCQAEGYPAGPPVHSFETDVCTCWPDGNWGDCCVEHDIDYWCGGTSRQRLESDARLRSCMTRRSYLPGVLMFLGVRFGGVHWLPTSWRWGFGHDYPAGHVRGRAGPRGSAPTQEESAPEP